MAYNPLYNTNDSPNGATQPTRAVNNQAVHVSRTHNNFDMSYMNFLTQKFGFYHPFFYMEGVAGDVISLQSSHEVRTLPMSSPLLSGLTLHKDYFMVPNMAIQPNTYEYIFKTPSQGDDVPDDAYNLFPIPGGPDDEYNFVESLALNLEDFITSANIGEPAYIQWLLISELFFSSGCLLYNLGYKLNPRFEVNGKITNFDGFFDTFVSNISNWTITINSPYFVASYTKDEIDVYTWLSLIRRYGSLCSFTYEFEEFEFKFLGNIPDSNNRPNDYMNLDRVCAYQLACAQYFVNPQIDFVYNAQLFRDNFFSLLRNVNINQDYFYINGIQIPYDVFSLHNFKKLVFNAIYRLDSQGMNAVDFGDYYDLFNYLFGYREQLRYGDYFTDSRTRALALGEDNVTVSGSNVSVIDITKRIVFQRFRNAVVKLGNNFGDYLRGIFGEDPSPDYHIPKYIIHSEFSVDGSEVANTTSSDQGKLVTSMKTQNDNYEFEIKVDMPCILIGMSSFSLPRSYCQTKDRPFFHTNRYDFFNPMLQYVGDQPVYNAERTDMRPDDEVFGYQSRYNEYKQRYNVVSGAFVGTSLGSWTFITDSLFDPYTDLAISNTQSPDFIRAHDFEFNRFFSTVPGYSLSNGFHFIMRYTNNVSSVRPMEINPGIL